MPKGIPQGFKPLSDGVHIITVKEVVTAKDSYQKPQEVVTCIKKDDNPTEPDQEIRLYFPHNSKKWFDQGVAAGIIEVSGEVWNVIPGRQCRALVQGGKVVQIFAL